MADNIRHYMRKIEMLVAGQKSNDEDHRDMFRKIYTLEYFLVCQTLEHEGKQTKNFTHIKNVVRGVKKLLRA